MPYSEAQKRATMKYQKNNMEIISIRYRFGIRDRWKKAADISGMPLSEFIRQAVEEKIRNEVQELSIEEEQ